MNDDTTILPFNQPGSIIDPLTEIARERARRMLMAFTITDDLPQHQEFPVGGEDAP